MENLNYKIDQFEGPLDLLLSLVAKNKININDIPIAIICDQYMEYLDTAAAVDMELSAEFLVMASELMLIKSRMLLPRDEENEEDPRASLAAAMLEYQKAKEASVVLGQLYSVYGLRYAKETDEITVDKTFVADHDSLLLLRAMNKLLAMERVNITPEDEKKRITPLLQKKKVSVGDKIGELRRITAISPIRLVDYFYRAESRTELIVMFMAVLELLRDEILEISDGSDGENGVIDVCDNVIISAAPDADQKSITYKIEFDPDASAQIQS